MVLRWTCVPDVCPALGTKLVSPPAYTKSTERFVDEQVIKQGNEEVIVDDTLLVLYQYLVDEERSEMELQMTL